MAGGVDLVLNSLRGVGSGIDSLGEGLQVRQERKERDAALAAKQAENERILQERTGIAAEMKGISDIATKPESTLEEVVAQTTPLKEKVILSGNTDLLKVLESYEDIPRNRAKAAKEAADAAAKGGKEKDKDAKEAVDLGFKERAELRDVKSKYLHQKETENTRIRGSSYNQINKIVNGEPSPAGDLSLIFSYMKLLDPPSTVREGEQALAENARGVPDGIRNMYNKVLTGERLTPDQRKDFQGQAKSLYKTQLVAQEETDGATLKELEVIAKGDKKKLQALRDQVLPKTATERLKELDDEEKAAAKKSGKKEDGTTPGKPAISPSGKPITKYGASAGDAIFKANAAKMDAWVQKKNAERAAKGQPPMSDAEIRTATIKKAEHDGIVIDPSMP